MSFRAKRRISLWFGAERGREIKARSFAAMKMAEAFVENTGVTSKEPFSCTVVSRRIIHAQW
ncbi:hypothetical protein SBA2_430005 [Acidobacteriia bacterium SbA2]|nr:hypothetical protein SBA2_430005 [Acidobacteriia bacterium SbA2]